MNEGTELWWIYSQYGGQYLDHEDGLEVKIYNFVLS